MSHPAHSTGEQRSPDRAFIVSVSGATYTPDYQDRLNMIQFTGADPATYTVPANATVPYPVGAIMTVLQSGAGAVTIAGAVGVTLNYLSTLSLVFAGQHSVVQLLKTGTNAWTVFGALTPA